MTAVSHENQLDVLLNRAFQSHQSGDLPLAEDQYAQVLQIDPLHADALHLLGQIRHKTGDLRHALVLIEKAISIAPDFPAYYVSLADVQADMGELQNAIRLYQTAIRLDPNLCEAHFNMGNAFFRINDFGSAVSSYKKALRVKPDLIDALNNMGLAYHIQKEFSHAVSCFQEAIAIRPKCADTHNNLGNSLVETGMEAEAVASYETALSVDPDHFDALYNLGNLFHRRKLFDKALSVYHQALTLKPDHADLCVNLGRTYHVTGFPEKAFTYYEKAAALSSNIPELDFYMGNALLDQLKIDEAIQYYSRLIRKIPNHVDGLINMGIAFHTKDHLEEAIHYYNEALKSAPHNPKAFNNLGKCFRDRLDLKNALLCYGKAIKLHPDYAEAHSNRAFCLLLSGRFKEGWREYEWRLKEKNIFPESDTRPTWNGEACPEKSVLVYAEQGIGDEIMFASCLKDLSQCVANVFVECDKRLIPLFERSFPGVRFIKRHSLKNADPFDISDASMRIALGSLPYHFRRCEADFPKQHHFLSADPAKTLKWRKRYEALGPGLKIGISWKAGNPKNTGRIRSIPLQEWHDILLFPHIHFVNLQYGPCAEEMRDITSRYGIVIHDWEDADPLKDMDDFAAKISALDLVISVDNSTVHLAGSLGVRVWTLLPFSPDWRWMTGREDSPWYASMRLFRQKAAGDWAGVLKAIRAELEKNDSPTPLLVTDTSDRESSALNRQGLKYLRQGKPKEAVLFFLSSLKLRPDASGVRMNLGIAFMNLGRTDLAIEQYRNAIGINPESPDAWYNLGNALKALGRMDEAYSAYGRAVTINPAHVEALRQIGVIHHYSKGDPDFIRLTKLQKDLPALQGNDRISLQFALGKAYADIREYDTSFSHYAAGAALKRQALDYNVSNEIEFIQAVEKNYPRELFNAGKGMGSPSKVPIFILGMPRSGTTLVEQILGSHPDVHAAGELTELERTANGRFLMAEKGLPEPDIFKNAGETYVARLKALANDPDIVHITDKMPGNFMLIGYIHLILPNATIIHCVRNPLDTCLSCFQKLFTHKHEWTYDLFELGRYYLTYRRLMNHWRSVLPGRFLDVVYEELTSDPNTQIRRILAHCELPWNDGCLSFYRTKRDITTASDTQVRRPIYRSSVNRWKHYEKWLEPLIRILQQSGID